MVDRLIVLNMPHPIIIMKNICFNRRHIRRCWFIYFFQFPFFPERQITLHGAAMIWNIFRTQFINQDRMSMNDIAIFQDALLKENGTATAILNYYRNLFTIRSLWMGKHMTKKLDVETLIIWGLRDETLDFSLCEQSIAYLKHARVVQIPESSHYPQQDTPDEVNEVIELFLTQTKEKEEKEEKDERKHEKQE